MKVLASSRFWRRSGTTLVELLVASSIMAIIFATLMVSLVMIQRTFLAASHHAINQAAQLRMLDYMALDLRRALSVVVVDEGKRTDILIPDFYTSADPQNRTIRNPTWINNRIEYGPTNVTVSYYEEAGTVFREANGFRTALATDIKKFNLDFALSGTVMTIKTTFVPIFRYSQTTNESENDERRLGTALSTSILLRNKR